MSREETKLKAIELICGKLLERNAVLFLGAGINAGIKNNKHENAPLGQELSNWIAKDLLGSNSLNVTLDEAAEMARHRVGEEELNRYLFQLFNSFKPGTAHLTLVQLPWDIIYTTNFDLLVEEASKNKSITSAGTIRSIFSNSTILSPFSENDILYYKLHGSIDYANNDGKLILTKEDYRHYTIYRKPLFKRLERDLLNRTFVFVGYALKDPNFREILEDCREILGMKTFPISFAIKDNFEDVEATFWKDKYNVQLIEADASEFLQLLKKTWTEQNLQVIPFDTRKERKYMQIGHGTRFPKVGESFYRIDTHVTTEKSDPSLFFRGAEPSWGDIFEKIAPERDRYWTLFETIFPELSTPANTPSVYIITGAAGTGKTTLIYSLGYDIAKGFELPVLVHIPSTPLDINLISPLIDQKNPKRIIILIKHAAECISYIENFLVEAKQKALPVTLILEERKNQWESAIATTKRHLSPPEFELSTLSTQEIEKILDALSKYNMLGKLTGCEREYQTRHFVALADKELLVALRELTSDGKFDDIVRDEFNKIPSDIAKKVYLYVSALSQIDLPIRYETIIRILHLKIEQLKEVFLTTKGVLISGEEMGTSRHNSGFRLSTRHPIIASIIFSSEASDDDSKFKIFNDIISTLDPGYNEDRRLLQEITRNRQLVGVFVSPEKRRAIYERLESVLPDNPYVLQHRSLLEKDLDSPKLAVEYARKAVALDTQNIALLNTLGIVLEYAARDTTDPLKYKSLVTEASDIFEIGIKADPADPYGYIGKVLILRQQIFKQANEEQKAILQATALSFLEEAYEKTQKSTIIAGELAVQRDQLGDPKNAIQILKIAINKRPDDERLRDILIRLELKNDSPSAIRTAEDGVKLMPTSWRMQLHVARIKRKAGKPLDSVKGHYEAAIRNHRGDIDIMVELAAYLFMNGKKPEANTIFNDTRQLPIASYEKQKPRQSWRNDKHQNILFSGQIKRIVGASAHVIAIPQNFEAFFYRTSDALAKLKERDSVKFYVSFNAYGPVAKIIN